MIETSNAQYERSIAELDRIYPKAKGNLMPFYKFYKRLLVRDQKLLADIKNTTDYSEVLELLRLSSIARAEERKHERIKL